MSKLIAEISALPLGALFWSMLAAFATVFLVTEAITPYLEKLKKVANSNTPGSSVFAGSWKNVLVPIIISGTMAMCVVDTSASVLSHTFLLKVTISPAAIGLADLIALMGTCIAICFKAKRQKS